ncbi:anti-sigma factor family protein [Pseudomonas sp. Marseille-QA0892]
MNNIISDHDLHAYVDGRLDAERRRFVDDALARDPVLAAQVHGWLQDARTLRSALSQPSRPENPALDPIAIRARKRRRRGGQLATAASLALCLGIGGWGGWMARESVQPYADPPMSDAVQAYRLLVDGRMPPDMTATNPAELSNWLAVRFGGDVQMPNLEPAGFKAVSARMLSTPQGAAAMVLYRDRAGRTATFYIRPPGAGYRMMPKGERRDGELKARYWSGGRYNYAVVTKADDDIEKALRSATDG